MSVWFEDDMVTVHHGDALEVLAQLEAESIDAVVTDPPYGLEFMGKDWDKYRIDERVARWSGEGSGAAGNIKKVGMLNGSQLPSYTKSRQTAVCLTCGKRDAFRNPHACGDAAQWRTIRVDGVPMEMRAFQAWCEQWTAELFRVLKPGGHVVAFGGSRTWHRLAVAVEEAGFDLRDSIAWLYATGFPKSANVARLIDRRAGIEADTGGAYEPQTPEAQQWDGWGTALKPAFEPIVVGRKPPVGTIAENIEQYGTGALNVNGCRVVDPSDPGADALAADAEASAGRWPMNVVLDDDQAAALDRSTGKRFGDPLTSRVFPTFRYEPKAPTSERPNVDGVTHPTVKPVDLMRWLVRLVTPPGGVVLDPFAGSGTTAEAAIVEGFRSVAIEMSAEYLPLIRSRVTRELAPVLDFDAYGGA